MGAARGLLPWSCRRRSTRSPRIQQLRLGLQEKEATRDGSSATPDAVNSSVTSWQENIAQENASEESWEQGTSPRWQLRSRRHGRRAVQKKTLEPRGDPHLERVADISGCHHQSLISVGSSTVHDLAHALASEQRPRRRRLEQSTGSPCIDDEGVGPPASWQRRTAPSGLPHSTRSSPSSNVVSSALLKDGVDAEPRGPKICQLLHFV